jgi:tryptophan-rich sensory protein
MLELALLEIIILWICIVAMIYQFRKLDPVAAYLNIPYLMWVSFASVLTGSIAWINA